LICTIGNYTSSNLTEHLDEVSHDVVTDYLRSEPLTVHGVWELADKLIQDNPEAFVLVDDSVHVFYKLKSAQFIIEKVPTLKKERLKLLFKRGPLYY